MRETVILNQSELLFEVKFYFEKNRYDKLFRNWVLREKV